MKKDKSPYAEIALIKKRLLIEILIWFGLLSISAYHDISSEKKATIKLAQKEAISVFNKDQAIRIWSTQHGGVYVPVTSKTPPNPYLAHVPERDISSPSGKQLTLMNPAYMLRQVMSDFDESYNVRGRIVSLTPLNPINSPDAWERNALEQFENGISEVIELNHVNDKQFLRLIRPMVTHDGCLKCHGKQGYKTGDIRGGVSVTVPLEEYQTIESKVIRNIILTHTLLAVLGLVFLVLNYKRSKSNFIERKKAEILLSLSEERYRKLVEKTDDLITITDEKGVFTFVNEQSEKYLGLSPEECIGQSAFQFVHPDDRKKTEEWFAHCLANRDAETNIENRQINSRTNEVFWMQWTSNFYRDEDDIIISVGGIGHNISTRKQEELEKERLIVILNLALDEVKTLRGIIPICAYCKKIRDDKGAWDILEAYMTQHTDATFSHGICPDCFKKVEEEIEEV